MELKTKYQYTYFIYPYLIEEKNYQKYLYKLLKNEQCRLKLFDNKKDIQIDSYFLPEIKNKMFWSLNLEQDGLKSYETMDLKMKSAVLSKKYCNVFEYVLEKDIPGKINEKEGIFFDINKIEIVCFNTGICFILIKTALENNVNFSDVLNFNYKFRDIVSNIGHTKEYDSIKIQTKKLDNMQKFSDLLTKIAGKNITAKKINIDTDRLITYSYVCLAQDSWNESTDILSLEKEFEKYRTIKPANEQVRGITYQQENVYKEKYLYYGFANNATVLLTSDSNIQNYTSLLYEYENVQLYHFIYYLHQKIHLNKLNYEIKQARNFENIKSRFINFAKKDFIYEITNNSNGIILDKYYRMEQNLDENFIRIKAKYDLLYKEYEIDKTNRHHKWIAIIIGIIIAINLIKLWMSFK